jgi:hypothetical protein
MQQVPVSGHISRFIEKPARPPSTEAGTGRLMGVFKKRDDEKV